MMDAQDQPHCEACRADAPLATAEEIRAWQQEIPAWSVIENNAIKHLEREFVFKDFASALAFVNRVGEQAELENHHPLIELTWGRVKVSWWTHKIGGLHKNDFIMAVRTEGCYEGQ